MKSPRKNNNQLVFIATILLLIAIPISVLGTQNIQDIREEASREDLYFETEFDEEFSTVYAEVPWEQEIILGGELAKYGRIELGCNSKYCDCKDVEHDPPTDFKLQDDMLIWSNPQKVQNRFKWPITLSAHTAGDTDQKEATCITREITLEVTEDHPNVKPQCQLYNTPNKLDNMPQNHEAQFTIKALDPDNGIKKVDFEVFKGKQQVHTTSWKGNGEKILILNKDSTPPLSYKFEELGQFHVKATVTDTNGDTSECISADNPDINIVIPGENGSPIFKTDPYQQSSPSTSIKTGTQYSYTIEATDPNQDKIEHFIINETGWLNFTQEKTKNGIFKGTFTGTPSEPGSYTIAVALNDGFHNHYSTQIWVINVDSKTNDTPKVSIVKPAKGDSFIKGDTIYIEWDAKDSNLIETFDIYLSTNPTNKDTWNTIDTGIGYHYNSYLWDSNATPPNDYYIIVEATDNQDPPATGQGISEIFAINQPTPQPKPPDDPDDPDIPDNYPQILNVKPADKSNITETKPLISADIKASNDNQINEESITIKLDDEDITNVFDIRGGGEEDGSVLYSPSDPLTKGTHKVSISFRDTADKIAQKSWTFTIEDEDEDPSEEPDDDVFTIFGLKIPRRVAMVIGIGIFLLILALIIPWLFYAAWKRSAQQEDIYPSNQPPGPQPPTPTSPRPSPSPPKRPSLSGTSSTSRTTSSSSNSTSKKINVQSNKNSNLPSPKPSTSAKNDQTSSSSSSNKSIASKTSSKAPKPPSTKSQPPKGSSIKLKTSKSQKQKPKSASSNSQKDSSEISPKSSKSLSSKAQHSESSSSKPSFPKTAYEATSSPPTKKTSTKSNTKSQSSSTPQKPSAPPISSPPTSPPTKIKSTKATKSDTQTKSDSSTSHHKSKPHHKSADTKSTSKDKKTIPPAKKINIQSKDNNKNNRSNSSSNSKNNSTDQSRKNPSLKPEYKFGNKSKQQQTLSSKSPQQKPQTSTTDPSKSKTNSQQNPQTKPSINEKSKDNDSKSSKNKNGKNDGNIKKNILNAFKSISPQTSSDDNTTKSSNKQNQADKPDNQKKQMSSTFKPKLTPEDLYGIKKDSQSSTQKHNSSKSDNSNPPTPPPPNKTNKSSIRSKPSLASKSNPSKSTSDSSDSDKTIVPPTKPPGAA